MESLEGTKDGSSNSPLHFGDDPDHNREPGIFLRILDNNMIGNNKLQKLQVNSFLRKVCVVSSNKWLDCDGDPNHSRAWS